MTTLRLTDRQAQVVAAIRRGQGYGDIARELGITRRAVVDHIDRLARKIPNPDGLRPYLVVFEWSRRAACICTTNISGPSPGSASLGAGSGVTSKARFAEYSLSLPFTGFAMGGLFRSRT